MAVESDEQQEKEKKLLMLQGQNFKRGMLICALNIDILNH